MKKIYLLFFSLFTWAAVFSQTITISGQCITGSITATLSGTEAGKNYYIGSGTIAGFPGTGLSIYWIGAPDNVWVIAFDGQPFYFNTCNTTIPPGTSPNICQWELVPGNPACTGGPLVITGAVILPVTYLDFTATAGEQSVLLNWSTSQEINNIGFSVERSPDGQSWQQIGFVAGAGNASVVTHYSYTDASAGAGINYYRLRQQDVDGRTSYSKVVTANLQASTQFKVADNPGNGIYKITMAGAAGITSLRVTDATGRVVTQQQITGSTTILDISRMAPGGYWLRMQKGPDHTTVKLIKL